MIPLEFVGILPARRPASHKGDYGHVLIVGGGVGMPGAVYLAAMAALRVGAGQVSVAMNPRYADSMLPGLPEAMVHGVSTPAELNTLLAKATVVVLGPGLNTDAWAQGLFSAAVSTTLPCVVDASALRLLAQQPRHQENWVLTPHPGEAAGLLGCDVATVQADRPHAARDLVARYGGVAVLKGAHSLVYSDTAQGYCCDKGNPGMASAGMGDVLSGVIGGLLAQHLQPVDAAKLGVWLHAQAGDEAVAQGGMAGLIATDIIPFIRRALARIMAG